MNQKGTRHFKWLFLDVSRPLFTPKQRLQKAAHDQHRQHQNQIQTKACPNSIERLENLVANRVINQVVNPSEGRASCENIDDVIQKKI